MRLLVGELSAERIAELERAMQPGAASTSGFLAPGERLTEIIARDEQICGQRDIQPEQIADRLETLVGRAERISLQALRRAEHLEGVDVDNVRIVDVHARGGQHCPFADCGGFRYANRECRLQSIRTERAITFPGLIIHLVRDHHFFEGGVRHRLDPAAAIDVLELEPNVDYAPVYATETTWTPLMATAGRHADVKQRQAASFRGTQLDVGIDDARDVIEVAAGVLIYVKGETCVLIAEADHLVDERVIDGAIWPSERITPGTRIYKRSTSSYVV